MYERVVHHALYIAQLDVAHSAASEQDHTAPRRALTSGASFAFYFILFSVVCCQQHSSFFLLRLLLVSTTPYHTPARTRSVMATMETAAPPPTAEDLLLSKGNVNKLTPKEETMHRKELGELKPTPELLKYYRDRVTDFEREREELIGRLDAIGIRRAEQHQAEWELKKRTEEVAELQKALSEAHA